MSVNRVKRKNCVKDYSKVRTLVSVCLPVLHRRRYFQTMCTVLVQLSIGWRILFVWQPNIRRLCPGSWPRSVVTLALLCNTIQPYKHLSCRAWCGQMKPVGLMPSVLQCACNPEIARRLQFDVSEVRAELRLLRLGSPRAVSVWRPNAPVKPQSGGATAVSSLRKTTVSSSSVPRYFIQLWYRSAAASHTFDSQKPLRVKTVRVLHANHHIGRHGGFFIYTI